MEKKIRASQTRATDCVKIGRKLPCDTIRALPRFSSIMGPRITPITNGEGSYHKIISVSHLAVRQRIRITIKSYLIDVYFHPGVTRLIILNNNVSNF